MATTYRKKKEEGIKDVSEKEKIGNKTSIFKCKTVTKGYTSGNMKQNYFSPSGDLPSALLSTVAFRFSPLINKR